MAVEDLAPPEPTREAGEYARILEALAREAYGQALRQAKSDFHVDAVDPASPDALAAVAKRLLPMWKRIETRNTEHWETLITIPANANGLTDQAYERWVKDNAALIVNLADAERERARKTIQGSVQAGQSYADLTKQIERDLEVGQSRARLIARDQTLKANAQITEANHRSAGVDRFRWVANRDERVRPLHARLNGRLFTYPSGHPSEGIPGTHFQCRCFAYPIIPGVTDDEETAAMIGGSLESQVQGMRAELDEEYPGALRGPRPLARRVPRGDLAQATPRAQARAAQAAAAAVPTGMRPGVLPMLDFPGETIGKVPFHPNQDGGLSATVRAPEGRALVQLSPSGYPGAPWAASVVAEDTKGKRTSLSARGTDKAGAMAALAEVALTSFAPWVARLI